MFNKYDESLQLPTWLWCWEFYFGWLRCLPRKVCDLKESFDTQNTFLRVFILSSALCFLWTFSPFQYVIVLIVGYNFDQVSNFVFYFCRKFFSQFVAIEWPFWYYLFCVKYCLHLQKQDFYIGWITRTGTFTIIDTSIE